MRMRPTTPCLFVVLAGCAASGTIAPTKEVEVVGRLKNTDYSEVVRGQLAGRVIEVRHFGHTYLDDSQSGRFRLRRRPDGGYIICGTAGGSGFQCR